jgi:hypothetical protein
LCTALTTDSYCCGPVTESTPGCTERIACSLPPMQPVTMTLPFLLQRLADRVERFLLGAVEEAAGVDDHHVGAVIGVRDDIALRPQLGQDPLGIHQRLRTAEADDADLRGGLGRTLFHLDLKARRRPAAARIWRAVYRESPGRARAGGATLPSARSGLKFAAVTACA